MDFFEYAHVARMFVNSNSWWVPFLVGGLCFAIVYAFQSVGLFIIAGREGYSRRWMAFVPFLNTYYIGVCGQKNRTFKSIDTKTIAIAAAVLELLLAVGYVVYWVAFFKLGEANCLVETTELSVYGYVTQIELADAIPASLAWAGWCFSYLESYVLNIVDLVFLVCQVFVLSAFFQTYAARRYMLFTITSILFPIQGILIFFLRNNKGMNYREFMRMEQERQYRIYQQYRQQNNSGQDPYNQNPYSRNPYSEPRYGDGNGAQNGGYGGQGGSAQDDPFSEFGENGGGKGGSDPFEN